MECVECGRRFTTYEYRADDIEKLLRANPVRLKHPTMAAVMRTLSRYP